MLAETELIRLAKTGDTQAFGQLVQKHQSQIRATVLGMLGDVPEADEVAQEVFIRFYKSMKDFKGAAALSTYLTRIAINLSLNEIKRKQQKRRWLSSVQTENLPEVKDTYMNPSRFENRELIHHLLSFLEPEFRAVIVCRLIDGYSVKETAEILNVPQGTIASRLSRAQIKMKEIAKQLGVL